MPLPAAIPILGAAALAGGGLYLATKRDPVPEVQGSKHVAEDGTLAKVVVPTTPRCHAQA